MPARQLDFKPPSRLRRPIRYSRGSMKVTLVGSRYFGALVFEALRKDGVDIARVVAPAADDRLALAAKAPACRCTCWRIRSRCPARRSPTILVSSSRRTRTHGSATRRWRVRAWAASATIRRCCRDIAVSPPSNGRSWKAIPIAGGSVYHLADGWDAGAVAAQDWCFVAKGETARELWERALAPMGLALLTRVVRHAAEHGELPAYPQDPRFATKAPLVRRTVSLTDESKPEVVSLVVTAIGSDRPGIVRQLSERAQGFGANWAGSRMANIAGQFAGMVHFEVPAANADALAAALQGLESAGLRIVISKTAPPPAPAGRRLVTLELEGPDRPGIVRDHVTQSRGPWRQHRGAAHRDRRWRRRWSHVQGEGAAGRAGGARQ